MKAIGMERSSHSTTIIYDLDGTLCLNDTFKVYLFRVLFLHPWHWWKIPIVVGLAFVSLTFHLISNNLLKRIVLRLACKNITADEARRQAKEVMRYLRWDQNILDHFHKAKRQNKLTILATASPEIYVGYLAEEMGFDLVVCTEMHQDNKGMWSGEMSSLNCFGEEKAARLTEVLHEKSVDWRQCTFISDSDADVPSFELAGQSFAVRPSKKLSRIMLIAGIRPFSG